MPPKVKKRGCPKGHQLTTIGLPAKKQRTEGTNSMKKPCSFQKLHTSFKEKGTVSSYVLRINSISVKV